jgi:hypothetical protein
VCKKERGGGKGLVGASWTAHRPGEHQTGDSPHTHTSFLWHKHPRSVHHGALTEAVVGAHNVVVFTGLSLKDLLRWNEFCHARSIAFVAADVRVRAL